jgi:hypothetical protein
MVGRSENNQIFLWGAGLVVKSTVTKSGRELN